MELPKLSYDIIDELYNLGWMVDITGYSTSKGYMAEKIIIRTVNDKFASYDEWRNLQNIITFILLQKPPTRITPEYLPVDKL